MSHVRLAPLLFLNFCIFLSARSQDDSAQRQQLLPEKFITQVSGKLSAVENKLSRQTLKALKKFEQQERKLKAKLQKKDSSATKEIFLGSAEKIQQLQIEFESLPDKAISKLKGEYDAYMDTLQTTFKYLKDKVNSTSGKAKEIEEKLKQATSKLNLLQSKLQKADEIKKYLRERREIIKQQLQKFGMVKHLKKLDKSAYYYSQYLAEYKSILKDRKKAEQKAMSLLYKIPAFKKFVSENSMLASLFPGRSGNAVGLSPSQLLQGLQSRSGIQQYLQTNITSVGGPNANSLIAQQIAIGNSELEKLKAKISKYGGDGEVPTFKKNDLKGKSLLKRIEYGANIQFAKSNNFFPTTSDIALSLGYKLKSNGSAIGLGASYKLGLGKGFDNIHLTNEGLGLRSYLDIKLKGQFFLSGGYEQNYLTAFGSFRQLNSNWLQSGLIGLSKKYQISSRAKGKIQLLYDFLSNSHYPPTQALIFRTGFNLK